MKLTLRDEYALRAMMALGEHYDGEIVPIQVISEQHHIPKRFLEQILNDLRFGGFVESRRGPAGGYRLAMPPEEITLAALMHHLEGALVPTPVAEKNSRPGARADEMQGAIRSVIKEVRAAILGVLEELTVADLCERARNMRHLTAAASDFVI